MPCTGLEPRLVKHYGVKDGELIRYVDAISLYPYICKYDKFSVGYPKVHVGSDCPPECLVSEGVIKCKGLPPRGLTSSCSIQKQLQTDVPLVLSCADTMNQDDCNTLIRSAI